MVRNKVVVALYPFKAIEGGDLSLDKVSASEWPLDRVRRCPRATNVYLLLGPSNLRLMLHKLRGCRNDWYLLLGGIAGCVARACVT